MSEHQQRSAEHGQLEYLIFGRTSPGCTITTRSFRSAGARPARTSRSLKLSDAPNAVAECLRDVAVVAMDCVHHEFERGVDGGARLLGVEVFHERG